MKKLIFILAFGAMVALTACGSGSTTTESTDSTSVVTDTTSVVTDTTVKGGAGGGVMDSPSDSKEQLPQTDEVK